MDSVMTLSVSGAMLGSILQLDISGAMLGDIVSLRSGLNHGIDKRQQA